MVKAITKIGNSQGIRVPKPLLDQLAEGGIIVLPLGASDDAQELVRIRKEEGKALTEHITGVRFVPMTGEIQKKAD